MQFVVSNHLFFAVGWLCVDVMFVQKTLEKWSLGFVVTILDCLVLKVFVHHFGLVILLNPGGNFLVVDIIQVLIKSSLQVRECFKEFRIFR